MVERLIDRYVQLVLRELPVTQRRRAKRELEENLYDLLREYTQGETPTARDVRAILSEVGDAEDVAAEYRLLHGKKQIFLMPDGISLVQRIAQIVFVFALVLVFVGLVLFVWGAVNNLMPVLVGVVLSLGVMAASMFLPMPDDLRKQKVLEIQTASDANTAQASPAEEDFFESDIFQIR